MIKPRAELLNIETYETVSYPEKWDMKLDSNENYIGPSTKVINALKNLETEDISHYPCYGKLYDKLAELYDSDTSNLVITNGADESLSALMNTYLSKGDKVVAVKPSFSMPKIFSEIIGAEYVEIPYAQKWVFPFESFVSTIDEKTKVIIITTPNNPTGEVIPPKKLEELLSKFTDKLVIIDETYGNYADYSNVPLVFQYDNAAVVRSFSKDYGLAGLRLGYIVSNSENIKHVKKVLSPYNVNAAAVIAGYESLSDNSYLGFVKNETTRSREFLTEELKEQGATVYESQANFILADFGENALKVYGKLTENKIAVKNFSSDELKNCLRITIPTLTGAQKIINLITPKDTIVFDMDGVMIDVSRSYLEAIKHTYKHFTGKDLENEKIGTARKQGGLNNDWDITQYLIKQSGFDFPYEEIVAVFQKQYWNDGKGVINDEDLLIDTNLLQKLSEKYNLAVFTGRPKEEAIYTLNKFEIKKYFSKIVTMDDVPIDRQKPDTLGLIMINETFLTNKIVYCGDTVDDAKCAGDFGCFGVGVLPPSDKSEELKELLFQRGSSVVIKNINELKDILENLG